MYAVSGGASRVLSGMNTAPSFAVANIVSTSSIEFGPRKATRSPRLTPLAARPCASRVVFSASSAYVRLRPTWMRAVLPGVIRARLAGHEPSP